MKTAVIGFQQISKERTLRSDYAFQSYLSNNASSDDSYYSFGELFDICENKFDCDKLRGKFRYCQISDVSKEGIPYPVTLNFDARDLLDENYYKKIEKGDIIEVDTDDILLSFLLPQDKTLIGKFLRVNELYSDIYFTNAFIRIKPKVFPEVMYYYLRGPLYKDILAISRIRKGYTGYATVAAEDLKTIHIQKRIIDLIEVQYSHLKEQILTTERAIHKENLALRSEQELIDDVFSRNYGFHLSVLEEKKQNKISFISQDHFSNNPDLRFSAKFHRESGNFVACELHRKTDKKIKHYLAEPIILGASISPSDYSEDGSYYYISMATIKNWKFDSQSANKVSKKYSDSKQAKTVQKNDIILARSGEGTIGKVALIDDDEIQGIFADFTMRIRLKDYNPEFAYYYFRTTYFQYLIEIYKKGLGNNTNIFPVIVREFPMLDVPLDEQQRIVDEIHAEIAKQNHIKQQIESLRSHIDKMIANALT